MQQGDEKTVLPSGMYHEASPIPSTALRDYEILGEIARGGMGVVYKARQLSLNRIVALKMILAGQLASGDEVKRFRLEAESAAGLSHPGIVPIYEIGEQAGQHFFSMGFVDGPSLASVLTSGPMAPRDAADCLSKICDAIQYAHDCGVIHRDLKPGNILLGSEGSSGISPGHHGSPASLVASPTRKSAAQDLTQEFSKTLDGEQALTVPGDPAATTVRDRALAPGNSGIHVKSAGIGFGAPKVTDFGLAKLINAGSELTGTGQILGTPSYMSPEQADGKIGQVGALSDVYSLGAILYCMLTGRPPFQSNSPVDVVLQVLKASPVPLRQLNPAIPKDLETLCLKAIEKNPAKRFESAGELAEELRRFLRGEPILARPISKWERSYRWLRRHPAIAAAGIVSLFSLSAILGTIVVANRRLESERDRAVDARDLARRQTVLAQSRLDMAIEAVEKMMTRAASERWSLSPELQAERRLVFEDAVALYQSFVRESDNDPKIRFESARANLKLAQTYILLNDLTKAKAYVQKSETLLTGLISGDPDNPEYLANLSEVNGVAASLYGLSGDYEMAGSRYASALTLAEKALAKDPGNSTYLTQALNSKSYLAYFLISTDPAQGRKIRDNLSKQVETLLQQEYVGFEVNAAIAFAMTVHGAYLLSESKFPQAKAVYEKADEIVRRIQNQLPTSARQAEQFKYCTAIIRIQSGFVRCLTTREIDALAEGIQIMNQGRDLLEELLRLYPKAFPYRMQKMQVLRALAAANQRIGKSTNAEDLNQQADNLHNELIRENPDLQWLAQLNVLVRSSNWVTQVRNGTIQEIEDEAKLFLKNNPPSRDGDVAYNVACAYALMARQVSPQQQEFISQAMTVLRDLQKAGYFDIQSRVLHLREDQDLEALHQLAEFKEFSVGLEN